MLHFPYWRYLNIHRRRNWINVVQKLCTTDQYILPFNMYRCKTKRTYECARSIQTGGIDSWHTQPHIHTHAHTNTHRAHQGSALWFHDSLESDKIQLIFFLLPDYLSSNSYTLFSCCLLPLYSSCLLRTYEYYAERDNTRVDQVLSNENIYFYRVLLLTATAMRNMQVFKYTYSLFSA